MTTILIDPGHGGSDPGAQYKGFNEKDFNLDISLKLRNYLLQNYQVNVIMSRTTNETVSLEARTNLANSRNVDFFLSIHHNAGGGTGFESYIYNGNISNQTVQYQNTIHDNIISRISSKYGVANRGKKRANFHVLRESSMPALLLEVLFIDNDNDLRLMRNSQFVNDVVISTGEGVAKALKLPKKESPPANGTLYRVIAGSFREIENAETRVSFLKSHNIESFIDPVIVNNERYYRVQAGAFKERENAEQQVTKLSSIGIEGAFIITEKGDNETPPIQTLYKVIAGSFKETENAENRVAFLKNKNIDSFIVPVILNNERFYRVQAGAFEKKEHADLQIAKLKRLGIAGAFVIVVNGEDDSPPPAPEGYPIEGSSVLRGKQLDQYVKTVNQTAPQLGQLYVEIGSKYGINGDIAYSQAVHETNYFRFTGIVKPEQNNYAGIGATGPGNPGASFKTPREGVLAHIQHLYAYATTKPLPENEELVDPRFSLVTRGSAPTWESLNGKWAVPGDRYGQLILGIYEKNINDAINELDKQKQLLQKRKNEIK
ncbi:cell division septation protein DedD [Bacillus pakistanensis]|uniref:Cell division septation protein DedD n=1 Tax=Rossellomorea pakistanensis TaxID=992288 RepID=A0ABS2N7N3_9BACI|nr:N-acetylmuramoyl-L-alanine amidase [Bacillus pakistanensis]MBM7583867.1 cell division septation protein DedD [Bacillus pakistanensis]